MKTSDALKSRVQTYEEVIHELTQISSMGSMYSYKDELRARVDELKKTLEEVEQDGND